MANHRSSGAKNSVKSTVTCSSTACRYLRSKIDPFVSGNASQIEVPTRTSRLRPTIRSPSALM